MDARPLVSARLRSATAVVSLGLATTGVAHAEQAQEAPEEIVVTGVRTGVLKHDPTAFSNAIFTDDFEAENKSLADLLSEGEGVFVRRFGGAGDRSEVSIRGSSPAQVVVSIDGVRANSALSGGLNLSRLCLPLVESVEIYRGAGATWQGSGAVGGTVNLNTRSETDQPVNRIGFSGGAFETYEGSIFRAATAGALGYSLGYCGFATQGDFDFARPTYVGQGGQFLSFIPDEAERFNNDRIQHGSTIGLGVPLGRGRLRFSDYFAHSRGGEPGIDCCNGVDAGQRLEARSTDWSNLAQLRWDATSLGRFGDDVELSLYHRYEASDFEDPPLNEFSDPIDVTAHISTLGARFEDRWKLAIGPSLHVPGLQLDFAHDRLDSSEQPVRSRAVTAATLDDRVTFFDERLLVAAALRADWTEDFGWHRIPSLGVVLTPLRWLRIRGNAGRAFRVPNFDELYLPDKGFILGNPELDPEDALNLDAGLELQLAQLGPLSSLKLSASYFWRKIDESIVWMLINQSSIAPRNTGPATSEGVELSLAFKLTDYLHFSIHHTELDSTRDATGLRLPGQPERESFGRVQIGPPEAWKLVGEAQHTGDILVSEGGGTRLPSRTVWNASASLNLASIPGFGLGPHLSALWLFFEINNIGDVAVRDSLAFPQPGRHASAGFEVSW
jgi:iron complex outermembrane receptor protein